MANADIDLDALKEDLGITDDASDAWLQRRVDGIWARIEAYTSRQLCSPPKPFTDDWGLIAEAVRYELRPPSWDYMPNATVFLRQFPVASVTAIQIDGGDGVPGDVRFDGKTGKLFSLRAGEWSWDVSRMLVPSRVKITYTAGWAEVPADLYEIVLGAMQVLWNSRQHQGGESLGAVTQVDVQDVGSVQIGATNPFVESASKASGGSDPLLGPYLGMLDLYVDHRSGIGWAYQPVSTS